MTTLRSDPRAGLDALHDACSATAERFRDEHGAEVDAYRALISDGIEGALAELRAEMLDASGGNEVVREVAEQLSAYVAWMQWALWDLPLMAVALDADPDEFRDAVTSCGLAYIAIRAFDDVIDDHFAYKGRRDTLLGALGTTYGHAQEARALSTLGGLVLCFEGLRRLTLTRGGGATAETVLGSLRRTVIGAIMEYTPQPDWSRDDYVRMVRLKNVDYYRTLYAALDPDSASPLHHFFDRFYEVAQYLNDVDDFDEDAKRGQPNLLALQALANGNGSSLRPVDDPRPWAVTEDIESLLAEHALELGLLACALEGVEREVAETKLLDLLDNARALGLFGAETAAPEPPSAPDLRLYPFSELSDVVEQVGGHALVDVDCAACGAGTRSELFRKQGFRFHRCTVCGHVYVSPRASDEVLEAMAASLDAGPVADKYLEVQRFYAEHICHVLRRRSPGARLLDVGFGRGYVLQMAQVYGFEAYGVDASPALVEPMRQLFGSRVAHAVVGRDPLPWTSFDVVVMSHVLEHLGDPGAALREIAARLNPGGWLYVAVPDLRSMDFRVFGKQWDVISPLLHLQYFDEGSLRRLLEASGLESVQRIRHPELRDEASPRWMRLFRQLGGSAASELSMLARVPDDPAFYPREATD